MLKDPSEMAVADDVVDQPKQNDDQLRVLARIKRAVRRKTNGGVQKLAVQQQGDAILLRGTCTSFYCKQVAQVTAMNFLKKSGEQLLNEIEVSPAPH